MTDPIIPPYPADTCSTRSTVAPSDKAAAFVAEWLPFVAEALEPNAPLPGIAPAMRRVDGGYVREDAHPGVGEPDWKAEALKTLPCGHPASLALRSVESPTVLCELCEAKNAARDAEKMEASLREELAAARAERDSLRAEVERLKGANINRPSLLDCGLCGQKHREPKCPASPLWRELHRLRAALSECANVGCEDCAAKLSPPEVTPPPRPQGSYRHRRRNGNALHHRSGLHDDPRVLGLRRSHDRRTDALPVLRGSRRPRVDRHRRGGGTIRAPLHQPGLPCVQCGRGCPSSRGDAMTRPLCPACLGTRKRENGEPCTCCEDGHMRGIDDPTPEERRIAELERQVRDLREGGPSAKLVAVRAAVAAIEPFRGELDRMDLMWRVARALEIPKDLRPCCACDDAPCIHGGKDCECWACRLLVAAGIARVNRDPRPRAESDRLGGGA